VAAEFNRRDSGVVSAAPAGRKDPIFEVTGVSSADILRRCREIRGSGSVRWSGSPTWGAGASRRPAHGSPRLLDFADLRPEDFVRETHRVLLGRSASPADLDRRLGELGAGRTRMEIIMRLSLCPEGRRARRPRARGVALPALDIAGAAIERLSASRLGPGVVMAERIARTALMRPPSARSRKLLVAGTVLALTVGRRRRRRL
jgi:hypothetical protein